MPYTKKDYEDAKRARDRAQARLEMIRKSLGLPPEPRKRIKPPPKGMLAMALILKHVPPVMEYEDIVNRLYNDGAADNIDDFIGGPFTAIRKGLNWYIKHGLLAGRQVRITGETAKTANPVSITPKGMEHYAKLSKEWPL